MTDPETQQHTRADPDSTVANISDERAPLIPKPPLSTSTQTTENLTKTHFGLLLGVSLPLY